MGVFPFLEVRELMEKVFKRKMESLKSENQDAVKHQQSMALPWEKCSHLVHTDISLNVLASQSLKNAEQPQQPLNKALCWCEKGLFLSPCEI